MDSRFVGGFCFGALFGSWRAFAMVISLIGLGIGCSACSIDSGGEVVERISGRIAAIRPPLGGHDVEVDYQGRGIVALRGWVAQPGDRERVSAAVRDVDGVVAVENGLQVAVDPQAVHVDTGVLAEEEFFVKLRAGLVGRFYTVEIVREGQNRRVVGKVDSESTKDLIAAVAAEHFGQAHTLEISLVEPPPDHVVLQGVRSELASRAPDMAGKVHVVRVHKGVVLIEGDLADHLEVDGLLAAIVMVPGVRDIKSAITINGKPYALSGNLPNGAYSRK